MTTLIRLGIVVALLVTYWPHEADAGYRMKCYEKWINVLGSHKIKTNTACKALCMKLGKVRYWHKCRRWTLMDNTCYITAHHATTSPELKKMKGTVLCKPQYSRRGHHMYKCNAKTGYETKFHKTVRNIDDCKNACANTKYCAAAYYIAKHKLCSLRLCRFKTDHSVAKPADSTFLPCSHKPCTGTPYDALLGCSKWFFVYESAKHVSSAACQAMCTKEHHCRSWTMMAGLCHLNTDKKSKFKGMKTMSNKQYSYCRGNIHCSWSVGKETVYHKTMKSADDCQDACRDSTYCSGMYFLHASKLCTLRLCQLRAHAHKKDGVPADKSFKPCSHKPCHGWMKNSATGKVRCYETRGYGLQKSAKLDPKACQKACTELRCYWWTMVNKECTMLASTRAKTVKGFTSVDQLHFSYCRPKKHNVHDCEYKPKNIKTFYEKKVKSEAECELACAKTELCVAMIYISAGKHCSLRLCRHDDDHWATTTPHDNAFKLCGYKPCGGLKGKKPATCFSKGFYVLESSKTTTSAACQAKCTDRNHCWRWTMMAGLCHLTVPTKSKHVHVKGMHAMSKKSFIFCYGKLKGCKGGIEKIYHKTLPKWQDCQSACLKSSTCSGLYYLAGKKLCTIRICQIKGSKGVAKPADKTFKPCRHNPCQGKDKAATKKSVKNSKKKPKPKMPKDFKRLHCHASKYIKVLESTKTTTSTACKTLCTKGHCYRWTMMAGLCHISVPLASKLIGMKTMTNKLFAFCKGRITLCRGEEDVFHKTMPNEKKCKFACWKTAKCSGLYYLTKKKLCTIRVCRKKGSKDVAKPADKTFKPCSHKPCQGKARKEPKRKAAAKYKLKSCHWHKSYKVLESKNTKTAAACKALCSKGHYCTRWTMMAGLCHLTVRKDSKMVGMKSMTEKQFTFCYGRYRCRGTDNVYHKKMFKVDECKTACSNTPTCSGMYYLTTQKLCTIRVCQRKGIKGVAKPTDKTFKPCSHKPCQGRAVTGRRKGGSRKKKAGGLTYCHWHKYYKVLESKHTTTAAACKALCSKGHYCSRWTMMAGLCHLTVKKGSKMVGMKSMTEKQFTFCSGRYRCRGTENVYHKKMFKVDDCKTACSNTPTCSGMYYLTTQKLCTIRVCQRKGIKGVAKPTDTTFKPCSHKPCQGRAETGRRKGGSRKKKAGGLTNCHWHKYYKVLESKHTTTAAACKALCSKGHYCSRWTMMAGLCHLTVKKGSKMVGMKSMTEKQFTFCSGRYRCRGTENVYHKKMFKVDDCKTACSNTPTCSGMYYLTTEKLCTIRVCQRKGSKGVAKPTDTTFKPCSHKPCQGRAETGRRKGGSHKKKAGGRTYCHWHKYYKVLESKLTTTAAACKALCSKGHYCSRWTMMADLCHLTVKKGSKMVGMKSMTEKQFTFCSGRYRCRGTENVYHKKMFKVDDCKTACSNTPTCSGMYYLTTQKLCTIRVCQRKGIKGVAKPTDTTFKPCSHKPCQGRAETGRRKGGSRKKKAGGLTYCHWHKYYKVLESKHTTTAAACKAMCSKGHYCTRWTMMAGLCHLTVKKGSKMVGMKSMKEKQITICSGRLHYCHGTENIYHKKTSKVDNCKTACYNTATCTAMYYLKAEKLCTIKVCHKRGSKVVAKPADKAFKPCSHKPCQGKAERRPRKHGSGRNTGRLGCETTRRLNLLESKKTTTSAHCKTLCSKGHCYRWTMMANLCHLTVSKHSSKLNGMKTMKRKQFTFCKGKMHGCNGKENVYHKKVNSVHYCKAICSKTSTCSGMYYLTQQKLCTIRVCQRKGSKGVAKPTDKTFKPCSHKPCQGHPRDETKALKKKKSDKKKPTKKTAKKKTHRKSKPLNCAMGFWVTVLESKKTTTAVACQALCTKGHCTTWTMMDGLCHLTVPKSSKLVGMKTMTEKQFTFCNGNSVCKGTHEHVYNKKKTTLNVCKSACSQTSSCSGMYYLASHKLCTMIVCQEKGKVGAKPADKTFKQCSHKKCHGKAVEEIKKKKGYDPKKFMCPPHYFMTVRYSKSITTSSACAKECTKIGSSTCLKWALVNGACHLVCNMGYSNSIMTKLSYTEYNMCLVKARIQLCKAAGKESMFHKTVKTRDECKEACAHTTLCSAAYFLTKTKHCSIFLCKTKKDTAEAKPYDKTFKPCAKPPCTGVA